MAKAERRSRRDDLAALADEALDLIDRGARTAPFSTRPAGLDLGDAYRITAAMRARRQARGQRPIGRKIGFTNRTIWEEYGVYAPMWGYVYEHTARDLADVAHAVPLAGLAQPRLEPEIVFGLGAAPRAGMDEAALLGCVAWVAHGFEIVQSIFPDWKFAAADTVAANGLHGRLLVGERRPVEAANAESWLQSLADFEIDLLRDGEPVDRGRAANVLDGPLSALRHLVEMLAEDPDNPPLAAGEIVSTGTLTRAMPIAPGETWSTELSGVPLPGLQARFVGQSG